MDETTGIQPERERSLWREFTLFLAGQVNGKRSFEIAAVNCPDKDNSTAQGGWTTETVGLGLSDSVEEDETRGEDEDDNSITPRRDKLSVYQKAALALLTQPTMGAAAKQAGVSIRQLARYRKDKTFIAILDQLRKQVYDDATRAFKSQIVSSGLTAAKTLAEIAANVKVPEYARVNASAHLAKLILQVQELESIQARLTELEKGTAVADKHTFTKTETAGK